MYQVYFAADVDAELSEKLALCAQSVSILYDKKTIIALFNSEEEIPTFARDYILSINTLDEEIWKYRYLDSFNGIAVTPDVFIYPATKCMCDNSYKFLIAINPKDAFGDGTHPTTRMCIQTLQAIATRFNPEKLRHTSLCDVGTGTGILAIAASLFGFGIIDAFDIDSRAIERAKENAMLNGCTQINFFVSDIASLCAKKQYTVVVANLLTDIIEKNINPLVSLVEYGGTLIVSGISNRWVKGVIQKLTTHLELVNDQSMGDWHCVQFKKNNNAS